MIYLLSQMILALAVAALMGAAIGWIVHRASHTGQVQSLKDALTRQHQQLIQSQTDVSMLTDDYDDLHRKSREEIDILRVENRQIPPLTSNLEKSQLLVRQMMQKHEAKVHELTTRNKSLQGKLTKLDEQDQIKNKLAAELDAKRREKARQDAPAAPLYVSAESDNDPFDQVIEVSEVLHGEITHDEPLLDTDEVIELDADMRDAVATSLSDSSESIEAAQQETSLDKADNDSESLLHPNSDQAEPASEQFAFETELELSADMSGSNTEQLNFQLNENHSTSSVSDTDQQNLSSGIATQDHADQEADAQLDGSTDQSLLFDPVHQKDDLKQIFGIGPLTEQALYELGITSYSQLADLEQHDIQRIADALEIVPARIERDNWVGNARRQLEEVLEQL